jgi:hypothetical protein
VFVLPTFPYHFVSNFTKPKVMPRFNNASFCLIELG